MEHVQVNQIEERLDLIQRVGRIGDWTWDIAANTITWSDELYRIFGLDKAAYTPSLEKYAELVHPDDRWILREVNYLDNIRKERHTIEYRIIAQDTGEVKYVLTGGETSFDGAGNPQLVRGFLQDITPQKKAEELRRNSEAALKEAQRIAHVGHWQLDAATNHVFWSEELYRMFALEPADVSPDYNTHKRLFTPESWERLDSSLARTREKGEPYTLELEMIRSDGSRGWMLAMGEPVRDDRGTIIGMRGVAQDITDRKMAESALRQSEERYRLLVNASPFCIHEIGLDGRMLSMNRAGLDMMCLREEKEVVGVEYLSAVSERDRERIGVLLNAALEGTSSHFDFLAGDGTHYFKSCFVPIKDGAGRVMKLMGITEDITERKRAEDALKESENLLKTVLGLLPVGVWIQNENGDIVFGNQAGKRIWEGERYIGIDQFAEYKGWWLATGAEIGPHDWAAARAIEKGETSINEEVVIKCFDGSRKTILNSALPIRDDAGAIKGAIIVNQDITAQKQAEADLLGAKEAAEAATRLKDKFVSLVAHDLKGPLGSMVAYLKQLQHGTFKPEVVEKVMSTAISTGENMLGLIEDLLNISRMKTGKLKPEMRFIPAYFFAVKAAEEFRFRASQKGVLIVNSVSPAARLYADENLFYEVIRNLVSNAVKFSRNGQTVRIFTPEGRSSAIAVADEGVGIENGRLQHLFEYETKTSTTGTAGELGTGLGLPLSRDIVEAHGGTLTGTSAAGQGSIFTAAIPPVQPRLLFVDGDPLAALFMKQSAETLDVELEAAASGKAALELLGRFQPHLIIADVKLPDMDGLAFIEQVRGDAATANVPVIMTSAYTDPETARRLADVHLENLLSKPFASDELIARIRRIIG